MLFYAIPKPSDLIFADADAPGLADLKVCSRLHDPVENRQTPVVLSTHWTEKLIDLLFAPAFTQHCAGDFPTSAAAP
jgi:CheY-like chemotaxis protein